LLALKEIRRIAIVRLDKIGDLILTIPAIASLRIAFPTAKISAIVSPYNKVVLNGSPLVDEVIEWRWSLENIIRLRKAKFDLMAVFSPTTNSYLLAFFSGAKIRAGYVYANRLIPRLFTLLALNKRSVAHEVPHEVVQSLEVVKQFGIPVKESVKLELPVTAKAWAKHSLPPGMKIGLHFSNAWDTAFLSKLVPRLNQVAKVIVTYGPLENPPKLEAQFFGNLRFSEWGALAAECNVFISPNTGSMHLAASQGVPVIAVFEPKSQEEDERRWHPWQVPYRIFRKDDPELSDKILSTVRQWLKKN